MTPNFPDYAWACGFGAVAAVGELLSRYRDAPWRAVRQLPGWLYLAVNAASGVFGLWAVYLLNLKFGLTDEDAIRWVRVLAGGFSSLAILRSAVFVVKAGDKDIPSARQPLSRRSSPVWTALWTGRMLPAEPGS